MKEENEKKARRKPNLTRLRNFRRIMKDRATKIFSVGSVAGFYSEWSPSISTEGGEQQINPRGVEFKPATTGSGRQG
jgi:hypothetical protein